MRWNVVHVLPLVLVVLTPYSVHADAMRCGKRLVYDRNTMAEVRAACGEPTDASQRTEQRAHRTVGANGQVATYIVEVVVAEWTYDFGPHEFVRRVIFENGKIVRMERGGYGKPR